MRSVLVYDKSGRVAQEIARVNSVKNLCNVTSVDSVDEMAAKFNTGEYEMLVVGPGVSYDEYVQLFENLSPYTPFVNQVRKASAEQLAVLLDEARVLAGKLFSRTDGKLDKPTKLLMVDPALGGETEAKKAKVLARFYRFHEAKIANLDKHFKSDFTKFLASVDKPPTVIQF